jgi:hypothetical protein
MILVIPKLDVQIPQRIVTITIIVLVTVVIRSLDAKTCKYTLIGVLTTVLARLINVTLKRAAVLMNTSLVMIRISVPLMVVIQSSVVLTLKSLVTITLSAL